MPLLSCRSPSGGAQLLLLVRTDILCRALGDHDGEATEIATTITGPYISPVIVLRDPTGYHRTGCDTQSHWTGDTTHLDRHIDCQHRLASLLLHPGRRPR